MHSIKSSTAMVLHEGEEDVEDEDEESVKVMFSCFSYLVIFSSNFLLAVTFSHFSTFMSLDDRLN